MLTLSIAAILVSVPPVLLHLRSVDIPDDRRQQLTEILVDSIERVTERPVELTDDGIRAELEVILIGGVTQISMTLRNTRSGRVEDLALGAEARSWTLQIEALVRRALPPVAKPKTVIVSSTAPPEVSDDTVPLVLLGSSIALVGASLAFALAGRSSASDLSTRQMIDDEFRQTDDTRRVHLTISLALLGGAVASAGTAILTAAL